MDKEKILKLLRLSTSDNEHESLLAIKKANDILKRHNKTWDDMFVMTDQTIYRDRNNGDNGSYQRNCGHTGCVYKMRFGKHKGKFLDDMIRDDPSYAKWVTNQEWCSDWLKEMLNALNNEMSR